MVALRSHTREELTQALKIGKTIWTLDTGGDGVDDVLILEPGEELDDLWYEISIWCDDEPPEHWTLTLVDWAI